MRGLRPSLEPWVVVIDPTGRVNGKQTHSHLWMCFYPLSVSFPKCIRWHKGHLPTHTWGLITSTQKPMFKIFLICSENIQRRTRTKAFHLFGVWWYFFVCSRPDVVEMRKVKISLEQNKLALPYWSFRREIGLLEQPNSQQNKPLWQFTQSQDKSIVERIHCSTPQPLCCALLV